MPPRASAAVTPSRETDKVQRKPVRRDPERRRQQNILAQKKYRAKLRERLARLEELTAPAQQGEIIESIQDQQQEPYESSEATIYAASSDSSGCYHMGAPLSGSPVEASVQEALGSHEVAINPWNHVPQVSNLDQGELSLASWDPAAHIDPSLIFCDSQNHDQGYGQTTLATCGCSMLHVQIQTNNPFSGNGKNIRIIGLGSSPRPADPYMNHLRLEAVCTIAALYDVGMHLGLTEELLCEDESTSPFFRFSANSVDGATSQKLISSVKNTFRTLKPDLRPISEQITMKHHPYIDILPFPTLRKNLISCSSDFDEDGFFDDMITGLLCWGGAGVTRADRAISTGQVSTGTPWDSRSWEATEWFLKKYWGLLGGEEGELVRQSQWWRIMRGDTEITSPSEEI